MTELSVKDLQPLLQLTLGDDLIVENSTVKDLLPPGENYGSKIVSLHLMIKNGKNGKKEDLFLVGKLLPQNPQHRAMIDFSTTFRKEIYMYTELLPYYRKMEIESGVKEEEALDLAPKCYGSRLSLSPDSDFDDDAVILLENLKPKGYYCVDRRAGCDLKHAKLAVKAMARFHALGMATKEKDPEFFEILKEKSKMIDLANPEQLVALITMRCQDIADDPQIKKYFEVCGAMSKNLFESLMVPPTEPWTTIVHSDFWTNNLMYRKNIDGEPDDIKFIDFQNYLFSSPIREIIFFVICGLDHNASSHIDELIDLYYESIIERLKLLNCNVEIYSRESFDAKMRGDAQCEFGHCLCMLKIITIDNNPSIQDADNIQNVLACGNNNEIYIKKLRDFVQMYSRKGWLE